ncbi:hypothetical protein QZH41_005245 [Actinostola sp. cb2023]|nr:hypothetical protein QZH41_005245 [Actinostola sp. cb2023]
MKRLREKKQDSKGHAVSTRTSLKAREPLERSKGLARKRKVIKQRQEERKEKKKEQTKERVRRFREKRKLAEIVRPEPEVNCATPAFPSRMAKKRVKDKISPMLPKTPTKKAEIVESLAKSPSTRKILEKKGFLRNVAEKQEIEAMQSLVQDVAEGFAQVKKAKKADERSAYSAARSLAFGAAAKCNRHQSAVAKLVGIKRKQVSKGISHRAKVLKGDETCWLETKRKVRVDAMKEEEKQLIYDYWAMQASRPTGSKNEKIRKRLGKGKYLEHAKHVLEKTQTECFKEFQILHPEVKVKQRKFEQLKPFFVKGARERDRQSCLCRKHVECKMLFDSCMKFRKTTNTAHDQDVVQSFSFLTEAVDSTLCPKLDGSDYHQLECLMRNCDDCGVTKFITSNEERSDEVVVKWKRYEYVVVQDKNGVERRKISLVTKETSVGEMFNYFLELLKDYPYHSFMSKWQKEQFDCLVNNLPLNHIICVHDFSENYTCRSQDEIQSQYFDPNKVAIHVSIVYRHADLRTDGKQSSEDDPILIKEHIFALSDDNTQDYHFVHHTQGLILNYLRNDLHLNVEKVHEFTDGCAGQYKSKHTFGDLSCCLADFGCQIDRHFFETSHAKGEQDAAGANIKHRATLAVLRRETSINSAKDLHDYLSQHFVSPTSQSTSTTLKKRVYFHIPVTGEGSVNRNRQDRTFKELKGIRKLHSIQTTPSQCKFLTRHRTCMCQNCLLGQNESCENSDFVDNWVDVELTRAGAVAVTRQHKDCDVNERVNALTDLVEVNSIVAIAAADDSHYDYYLMKVVSNGATVLESDTIDDYGVGYQKGAFVLIGNFFLRDNIIDMTYKLDTKEAVVYANTVRSICGDLKHIKRRKALYKLLPSQHEEIMSTF